MSFANLFRSRIHTTPAARSECPFCPGATAMSGPLCTVCRAEALRLGGRYA